MLQGYDFSGLRVLAVDDNGFMGSLIFAMLRAFGVGRCDLANDGPSALENLSSKNSDLLIVDWRMPGMSGIDLVNYVRKHDDSPNPYLPIIMLSGMNEKKHIVAARNAGVNDFVSKPVAARDLYQRLVNLIENPRPFVRIGDYFGPDRRDKPRRGQNTPSTSRSNQDVKPAEDGWYLD